MIALSRTDIYSFFLFNYYKNSAFKQIILSLFQMLYSIATAKFCLSLMTCSQLSLEKWNNEQIIFPSPQPRLIGLFLAN